MYLERIKQNKNEQLLMKYELALDNMKVVCQMFSASLHSHIHYIHFNHLKVIIG